MESHKNTTRTMTKNRKGIINIYDDEIKISRSLMKEADLSS